MGESQPTLEMAPWRDTHNSAPTSETVPKTCYSSIAYDGLHGSFVGSHSSQVPTQHPQWKGFDKY